ncbi:HipA domain-containing protein [Emticicia aquatica]|uniref:HipA domain-containing protein n=1 Tax=Emticicia aquatica TaxID=1681835 RepID=UPI001EEBC551|nr:HipA domain-containing protein [Emticicia aquatica]
MIKNIGFSAKALKLLFDGKKVSSYLDFETPDFIYNNDFEYNIRQISISGVQVKYSLKLEENTLKLTEVGGRYILKPIPVGRFQFLEIAPENEHLTMQIASQIFRIETAENTLIYFKNAQPAYLVKRFDIKEDGTKWLQEDFSQIKQINKQSTGENYKYEGSYEEIATLIKKYCGAWQIEIERFYKVILFNYLFSNGDAHLKNFSLIQTKFGDFRLSPAYDLLCTFLHTPNEPAMALDLFENDYYSDSYNVLGYYSYNDFFEFGIKIGIPKNRVERIMHDFSNKSSAVRMMIDNSFFDKKTKEIYWNQYQHRLTGFLYKL